MRKLNVGAGEQGDGDVTLDLLSAVKPDVQGTATALPFAAESFDVIEMDQVLEHIPRRSSGPSSRSATACSGRADASRRGFPTRVAAQRPGSHPPIDLDVRNA